MHVMYKNYVAKSGLASLRLGKSGNGHIPIKAIQHCHRMIFFIHGHITLYYFIRVSAPDKSV